MRHAAFFLATAALAACSATPAPVADAPKTESSAAAPVESAEAPAPPPKAEVSHAMPTECAAHGDVCAPEGSVADRICKAGRTDLALAMFSKGTPWTRGYLTRDTDAWNASGGGQSHDKLLFDEEVIVLRKREAGGIIVGQGGGYQIIRWDGACADLQSEELTLKRPPKPKYAQIGWRNIDTPVRDAVLTNPKVSAAFEKRRKECKGVTSGDVSLACVKADAGLNAAIVEHVLGGGSLPAPKLP